MNRVTFLLVVTPLLLLSAAARRPESHLRLDELDVSPMQQGWGKPQKNRAIRETPLSIGGKRFEHGIGTHAPGECWISLDGKAAAFSSSVGVDDAAGSDKATVEFVVYGDGKEVWRSGVCRSGQPPTECRVNLAGIRELALIVTDAGDGMEFDHADWATAVFDYSGDAPRMVSGPVEEPVMLTPPAPPEPRIHGPKVYGVRPGSPFLYRIPTTGERPMKFSARDLPSGLVLDEDTGIISGSIVTAGTYRVGLSAKNRRWRNRRDLIIVVGSRLALTPPMGWNSWYIHYHRVSDKFMRQAADRMVATGMADVGYQYVSIDDCWMVKPDANDPEIGGAPRDPDGRIRPNRRFPDMKALTGYIHGKGLKAGIYISPGPRTCGGYEGSYRHEAQDARTFAEWGFDFLKYDWCSYSEVAGGSDRERLVKPYRLMWDELKKQDRDIVFNLCQYGMGSVWEWGGDVGNCWRTTGDLGLEGGSLSKGIYQVGLFNAGLSAFAAPGRWNDPDYLLIGWVGDAGHNGEGRPTTLTPNEQYSHMSMWCLMASPLIFGGDMAKLDPFTLNVLCNPEVIEIDQDRLGKQARIVRKTSDELALAKNLEDGSVAVGLFNLGPVTRQVVVSVADLGIRRVQRVRDLWRQEDLGKPTASLTPTLPRHGVMLYRVWPSR